MMIPRPSLSARRNTGMRQFKRFLVPATPYGRLLKKRCRAARATGSRITKRYGGFSGCRRANSPRAWIVKKKSVYLGASYGLKTLKDSKAYSYFLLSNADEASAARVWDDFCGEYAARQCNDFIGSALAVAAKERDFIALYYSYTDKAALTIVCTAPERIAGELRSIPVPDGIVPHYRCFWR